MSFNTGRVKCVVFDFDGVLADTEFGRFDHLSLILGERGIDLHQRCTKNHLVGLSTIAFFRKYFPELSERDIDEYSCIRQLDYFKNLEKYCVPYPGVNETIAYFKENGHTLILATANDTKAAHTLLQHIGVYEQFSDIYGREIMEDSNGHKSYLFLRDKLNFSLDECVVVEDSIVGVSASKRAGFYTIAMNRYDDNAIKATANKWVNNYEELINLFK